MRKQTGRLAAAVFIGSLALSGVAAPAAFADDAPGISQSQDQQVQYEANKLKVTFGDTSAILSVVDGTLVSDSDKVVVVGSALQVSIGEETYPVPALVTSTDAGTNVVIGGLVANFDNLGNFIGVNGAGKIVTKAAVEGSEAVEQVSHEFVVGEPAGLNAAASTVTVNGSDIPVTEVTDLGEGVHSAVLPDGQTLRVDADGNVANDANLTYVITPASEAVEAVPEESVDITVVGVEKEQAPVAEVVKRAFSADVRYTVVTAPAEEGGEPGKQTLYGKANFEVTKTDDVITITGGVDDLVASYQDGNLLLTAGDQVVATFPVEFNEDNTRLSLGTAFYVSFGADGSVLSTSGASVDGEGDAVYAKVTVPAWAAEFVTDDEFNDVRLGGEQAQEALASVQQRAAAGAIAKQEAYDKLVVEKNKAAEAEDVRVALEAVKAGIELKQDALADKVEPAEAAVTKADSDVKAKNTALANAKTAVSSNDAAIAKANKDVASKKVATANAKKALDAANKASASAKKNLDSANKASASAKKNLDSAKEAAKKAKSKAAKREANTKVTKANNTYKAKVKVAKAAASKYNSAVKATKAAASKYSAAVKAQSKSTSTLNTYKGKSAGLSTNVLKSDIAYQGARVAHQAAVAKFEGLNGQYQAYQSALDALSLESNKLDDRDFETLLADLEKAIQSHNEVAAAVVNHLAIGILPDEDPTIVPEVAPEPEPSEGVGA